MKASKFTDAQKVFIIRQVRRVLRLQTSVAMRGISQVTYFSWKKKSANGCEGAALAGRTAGFRPAELRVRRRHHRSSPKRQ
jgi:putative transposase